jgi:predicted acetyltransferase
VASVKGKNRTDLGPVAQRLARLLDVFSPWEGISLTYRQLAAELGKPVTGAAVKKWPRRKSFPADVARLIVAKAKERGIAGVTLEWVLWGEGVGPQKDPWMIRQRPVSMTQSSQQEPFGQLAPGIAEALEDDLSHNEYGQWSSVEVQRTVLWALKDLARRLRVLRFGMDKTFALTDQWAGKIGLPVRPGEQPTRQGG